MKGITNQGANTIKLSYFSTSKRSENKTLTEDFQA
jgi:hypothetical protein